MEGGRICEWVSERVCVDIIPNVLPYYNYIRWSEDEKQSFWSRYIYVSNPLSLLLTPVYCTQPTVYWIPTSHNITTEISYNGIDPNQPRKKFNPHSSIYTLFSSLHRAWLIYYTILQYIHTVLYIDRAGKARTVGTVGMRLSYILYPDRSEQYDPSTPYDEDDINHRRQRGEERRGGCSDWIFFPT